MAHHLRLYEQNQNINAILLFKEYIKIGTQDDVLDQGQLMIYFSLVFDRALTNQVLRKPKYKFTQPSKGRCMLNTSHLNDKKLAKHTNH